MSQPTVNISSCPNYEEKTLRHSMDEVLKSFREGGLISGRGQRVLIKPNMLAPSPAAKAVTTHPSFVKVLINLLHEEGAQVYVGDSPGRGSTAEVARACGILEVVKETGAKLLPFEKAVQVEFADARTCQSFPLSREALEMDTVINTAKLKTHALTGLSGAVKNCFGLVVGAQKKRFHARFPSVYDFGEMLLDLYLLTQPSVSMIDAVVAMEGPGPRSGRPRPLGVMAASTNAVALDALCAGLTGFSPAEVSTLLAAQRRGLPENNIKNVLVSGPYEKLRDEAFDKGASGRGWSFLWRFFPAWTRNLREMRRPWPVIEENCRRCGICLEHCPPGIIYSRIEEGEQSKPWIDYRECLRCYCCQEICPHGAIALKPRKPV